MLRSVTLNPRQFEATNEEIMSALGGTHMKAPEVMDDNELQRHLQKDHGRKNLYNMLRVHDLADHRADHQWFNTDDGRQSKRYHTHGHG